MARSRACRVCKGWHDLAEPWPAECYAHFGVIANAAPNIRPDGMDPVRSMADGKVYDSRSGYYGSVKRAGCEIVGDDRAGFGTPAGYAPRERVSDTMKRVIERMQ